MNKKYRYKVGDLVISTGESSLRTGVIYIVEENDRLTASKICRILAEDKSGRGTWVFEKHLMPVEIDREDCRFCKSECKMPTVCPFFIPIDFGVK